MIRAMRVDELLSWTQQLIVAWLPVNHVTTPELSRRRLAGASAIIGCMKNDRFKRILVWIADPFARDQLTLHKAAAIAQGLNAKLTLFHSVTSTQPSQSVASVKQQRRERLQALAAQYRIQCECIVEWDYPASEAILRRSL